MDAIFFVLLGVACIVGLGGALFVRDSWPERTVDEWRKPSYRRCFPRIRGSSGPR